MATTTPNFGWPVPTSTDLVKDGAVAIEGLGDAIDASLLDLKGGTTGQVLSKATNTDMDFTWVAQDDSNAIQNALLTTTGDTIYASAASTPARRAIGTTGQVLTVSGGVPVWATPAAPGFVGCQATANGTTQSYTQWTRVAINFSTEAFDTNGFHDNSTNNSRITIPTGYGGKYLFYGTYSIGTVPSQSFIYLMKNGALLSDPLQAGNFGNTYGNSNQIATGAIITEGAAGDYFTANIYGDYATGTKTVYGNLTCVYLGA